MKRFIWLLVLVLAVVVGGNLYLFQQLEHVQKHPVGRVVRVVDGDTIVVRTSGGEKVKVRVWGIDAPEMNQPGGRQAKAAAERWCLGKEFRLVKEGRGSDRYGRVIARVIIVPGRSDLGLTQIRSGWAWHFAKYAPDEEKYREAQLWAASRGLGVWGWPDPIPPWEWRKGKGAPMK